jgi:hypothetical protein
VIGVARNKYVRTAVNPDFASIIKLAASRQRMNVIAYTDKLSKNPELYQDLYREAKDYRSKLPLIMHKEKKKKSESIF